MYHELPDHGMGDHPDAYTLEDVHAVLKRMANFRMTTPYDTELKETKTKPVICGNLRPCQVWGWIMHCYNSLMNLEQMLDHTNAGHREMTTFISGVCLELEAALELLPAEA
jgi:hypothetical protein